MGFHLKILGGDDHNHGKSPILVTFTSLQDKSTLLEVVYKPRNAHTDKAILELFAAINALPEESKSGPALPFYKIEHINDGKASIWEYIKGDGLIMGASTTVKYMLPGEKRDNAEKNLLRLEQVCSRAGITNLHMENVLLTSHGELIPIDLEVV
ncbi:hypothetical protein PARA125_001767 [Parachlamydia sp. AcF125]|nr:hypothetical protein [Parachlamydia sp. AcF125]